MKSIPDVKKSRGRPATGINPAVTVRMPDEQLAEVDEWRAKQADLPSRPEAIRRLVDKGLEAG